MRRALAIETSGRVGSVALVEGEAVVAEEVFPHGLRHAAELIPLTDRLVRNREWRPENIQEIYVSIGPGSFTGLRIGVTMAKTLAFAAGARIVAVPSVQVLARNAPAGAHHALIVLDAKRGQIFTARFEYREGRPIEREPAHLDRLDAMLARSPRPVHLIGEGIPYHLERIPEDPGILQTAQDLWRARASAVAEIGLELSRAGRFTDPYSLTPLYIRLPEAEEKRLLDAPSPSIDGPSPTRHG